MWFVGSLHDKDIYLNVLRLILTHTFTYSEVQKREKHFREKDLGCHNVKTNVPSGVLLRVFYAILSALSELILG